MMDRRALMQDGIVQEIIETPAGAAPLEDRYHPDLIARMVPVGDEVQPGWLLVDGAWATPPAGPSLAEIRGRRDAALAASDWTQLPDAPLSAAQRQSWAAYRAALRAVPEQPGYPGAITWPPAPAA